MDFAVGQRVQARGLEWQILELEPLGAQHRLHLRCTGGDLHGLEWDLLHPFEPVAALQTALRIDRLMTLDSWRLHHTAALLDQVFGPETLLATQPGRLRIEPYQLVPLMRALELPRPRLLLADDVGLGKTVQAGLIVTELIARRQAHRVLVVAPAGPLLLQWQQELRQRFGLRFTTLTDSATLEAQRRTIELGGNPFQHHALTLVALDFAKQERVLQELERASWDLAIIDEAHHCISAGPAADRDATLRRRLAEVVASRSDGLLLLTATPHDGHDPHFCSLIELLDASLVDGRGGLVGSAYRRHVVRRLKSHLRDAGSGAPLFPQRVISPVAVAVRGAALAPVRAFHQALAALVAPRLRGAGRGRDATDALAFVGLLKRSVSTISACVATLGVVAERYRALATDTAQAAALHKERARALRALRRRTLRFGTLDAAEEGDAERLEAEHIAAGLHAHSGDTAAVLRGQGGSVDAPHAATDAKTAVPSARADAKTAELQARADAKAAVPSAGADATALALQALIALGQAALPHDPKLAALLQEVRLIRAQTPGANILVYTEYADSQRAAAEALRTARGVTGTVLTISGADTEDARTRAADRCSAEENIILLSTDSLAEGLNLQQRCHHLIHLDLPYNPNRLEQRNGRIDRYGQRHAPEIRYLYLAGTFEERLLLRLIAKYEKARARLESMPATLGVTADSTALGTGLIAGFAEEQVRLFEDAPPVIRTLEHAAEDADAAAYRDLLHEIDRAFAAYDREAVRHGWFAGQGLQADTSHLAAAEAAWRRGEQECGGIDLTSFVAAVLAGETGWSGVPDRLALPQDGRSAEPDRLPQDGRSAEPDRLALPQDGRSAERDRLALPEAWTAGLDTLPGYDPASRSIRITRSPATLRDADGATLAVLGRAHPLVRRAVAQAQQAENPVAAARGDSGTGAAALLIYRLELSGSHHTALRRVIAVRLPRTGVAVVLDHPEDWLRYAEPARAEPDAAAARTAAASWLPGRQSAANEAAHAAAQCLTAAFTRMQARRLQSEQDTLHRWLALRANELCGPVIQSGPDLFGVEPGCCTWQMASPPLERLAGFALDPGNSPARRREAHSVVALFRRRDADRAARAALSQPVLRPIGLLLLVPPDDGA